MLRLQRRVAAATHFIAIRLVIFSVRCALFLAGEVLNDYDLQQGSCGEVFLPREFVNRLPGYEKAESFSGHQYNFTSSGVGRTFVAGE